MFAGVLNGDGEGARHLKEVCSKRLHAVPVNVTKDESIAAALNYVKKHLPSEGGFTFVMLSLQHKNYLIAIKNPSLCLLVPKCLAKCS